MRTKFTLILLFVVLITMSAFSQKIVWKPKKDTPKEVQAGYSTVLNDEIYLIGGQSTNRRFYTEIYKYNTSTDGWLQMANIPTGRINFVALTVEETIYAIGGDPFLNINEAYTNSTWQTKAPMPTGRQHIAGCELNGSIYIVGGLESWQARAS